MANSLLDRAFNPLWTGPSRAAKFLADKIDNPQGEGSFLRGLLAGSLEGAGDVASDMTSPVSIASSVLGGSGVNALRRGKRLLSPSPMTPTRQNYSYSDEGRDLASLYDRMGPEFVPIGGEDVLNATRGAREAANLAKFKPAASESPIRSSLGGDDVAAKMAKVTTARTAASSSTNVVKGKADFLGFQDDFAGGGFNLYNVNWPGHPMDKSTITEEAAKKMGLL